MVKLTRLVTLAEGLSIYRLDYMTKIEASLASETVASLEAVPSKREARSKL